MKLNSSHLFAFTKEELEDPLKKCGYINGRAVVVKSSPEDNPETIRQVQQILLKSFVDFESKKS